MSRSIHRTRRELEEAERFDYSTEDATTAPTDPETIPFRVYEQKESAHYPASLSDIIAVMHRLPVIKEHKGHNSCWSTVAYYLSLTSVEVSNLDTPPSERI
ncbi:MAG TPA: hypothetical protein PLP86_04925 [Armatimonadota bacterium]|nr:hypothetical protein [Armatimonadota bacterium]